MQLMPKQLIGNIGGAYLKNSKSVLFHPQNCEALDALTKVMSSGFVSYYFIYEKIVVNFRLSRQVACTLPVYL